MVWLERFVPDEARGGATEGISMRKLTLLAGAVALMTLGGCTYNDGYYDDGYYGGYYGDYYGPGYYDPYYSGPGTYFDGTYYFYYDRSSHRWHRRDHDRRDRRGDRHDRDQRGDRDWSRHHDWRGDRNAPWNRDRANRSQPDQSDRRFRGNTGDWHRDDRQVSRPRTLAPPPAAQPTPSPRPSDRVERDRHDRDRPDRDRPDRDRRDRGNHDHH
jgi:hypothetical protein